MVIGDPQSAFDSFYFILHNIFSTVYPVRRSQLKAGIYLL